MVTFVSTGEDDYQRGCVVCGSFDELLLLYLGKDPYNFALLDGRLVVRNLRPMCKECRTHANDRLSFKEWDEEERRYCLEVVSKRPAARTYLHGIRLPGVSQNTVEWHLARFGPRLRRLGASACGAVLNVSSYGDRVALFQMLKGAADRGEWERGVLERWEYGGKSSATEYGHAYEDFVVRLVELLLPRYVIKDGGIRVPCDEKDRWRYAVSVDGDVYLKNEASDEDELRGYEGGFEAKCAYFKDHGAQARSENVRKNPQREFGVKAEHLAQMQMQMAVTGSPWTIYCSVKWVKFTPPHPELGVPPFEEVTLVRVPFSAHYWHKWAKPQLDRFSDALHGAGPTPTSREMDSPPPRLHGMMNLFEAERGASFRKLSLASQLLPWRTQHAEHASLREKEITQARLSAERAGLEVDYSEWW